MVLIRDVGIHPVLNLSADNKCRWDENSTKANVFLLQYLLFISYFTRILNFAIPLFGIKSREYKIAISNFFFVISNASKLSEKLERDLKIHQGCFSRDYAEINSSPFIFWIYSNRFASFDQHRPLWLTYVTVGPVPTRVTLAGVLCRGGPVTDAIDAGVAGTYV